MTQIHRGMGGAAPQENDPPGTDQTHAIAVNQQLRHHPRVVRRLATLLTAVHFIHRRNLERADHMHFVNDVEKSHEAFRTMPVEGDLAKIQADMRPIAELCTGEEAHRLIQDVTLAHFNATLRGRYQLMPNPRALERTTEIIPDSDG